MVRNVLRRLKSTRKQLSSVCHECIHEINQFDVAPTTHGRNS